MSSKDGGQPKKRGESRPGIRRVSSLSAEQLERKRANDREAQRLIRQRTKEHIEGLEKQVSSLQAQVAEMRPRSEQYNELLQQNAALQDEVSRLKHQLASLTGSPDQGGLVRSGWHMEEGPGNAASSIPTTNAMVSPFPGSFHPPSNVPRAPSAVSTSSRSSHPHDWQEYLSARSLSLAEAPEPALSDRMGPYVIEGQLPHSTRSVPSHISVATPQLSFDSTASSSQQPFETSLSHLYPRGGDLSTPSQPSVDQSVPRLVPSQRSMSSSMPGIDPSNAPTQPNPAQSYQSSGPSYHNSSAQPSQRDPSYPYTWSPQS